MTGQGGKGEGGKWESGSSNFQRSKQKLPMYQFKPFSHVQKQKIYEFYERGLLILSSHEWLLLQTFTEHEVKTNIL